MCCFCTNYTINYRWRRLGSLPSAEPCQCNLRNAPVSAWHGGRPWNIYNLVCLLFPSFWLRVCSQRPTNVTTNTQECLKAKTQKFNGCRRCQRSCGPCDRADILRECLPIRSQSYRFVILPFSFVSIANLQDLYDAGYTRVILAGLALHFMSYHPKYCTLAYVISCLLDAVDGQAARALGQTSKFGAVLDMVTDRFVSCLYLWDVIDIRYI